MPVRWLAPAGLVVTALAVAACGGSGYSGGSTPAPSTASSGTTLQTATIKGATVLTDSKGLTLYWFGPDTATKSNCNGSCAGFWPPVPAPATPGSGVTGTIGSIKRNDGSMQATYKGHPLYTYKGDTAPGQANGNGLNLNGGVWHEVTPSGAIVPASGSSSASPSSSSSGGGGGYGGY